MYLKDITEMDYFDTSQLTVDYSRLNGVGRSLVAPPFLTGSLKIDRATEGNILIIGLGGSQLNNFIHYFFPQLNITVIELEQSIVETARKYFGLKEDNTQHVITMDGVDFLREATNRGVKFDAIYMDVCPTGFSNKLTVMCPTSIFLDDDIIRLTRQCLKDSGTMVSKMLVFTERIAKETEMVADLYRKYFANCIVAPMPNILNRVSLFI
uniref:PABS domain-containing protein n=1 Tax=Ascaris lumbricoides TaxID=6252 RepID=A0A0M3I964_ASCLU